MTTMAPMRVELVSAADVTQDEYTIRESVNWFKGVYNAGKEVEVLAEQEADYFNSQFVKVVERTDKAAKLPHGPLGQFISSVALQELAISVANESDITA